MVLIFNAYHDGNQIYVPHHCAHHIFQIDTTEKLGTEKMGAINYFGLLLWKNWLLQKRKKVLTFFEIALPIFFAGNRLLLLLSTYQTFDQKRLVHTGDLEKYEHLLARDSAFFFCLNESYFITVILLLTRMAVSTETFTEPTTWQSFEALEDIKNSEFIGEHLNKSSVYNVSV